MSIGQNIKRIRKEKGLTQKELGALLGISQAAIGQFENDHSNLQLETIKKIANALDVPLSCILPWEEYKQTEEYEQNERHAQSTYAIVKVLEELYKRAEIVSVDAYNHGELQYFSNYISLGIEPNKIYIDADDFNLICNQIRQVLKSSIELVSKNENDILDQWLRESDIDELQTSELEHVVIKVKDIQQNHKYTK